MELITTYPEILQAGVSSGNSEDGYVRVILSGAVPQVQLAILFKKSYETDWEEGGEMSGLLWRGHRKKQALPAAAVLRHQVVSTHAACQWASNRGKIIHHPWEHRFCLWNAPATHHASCACLCAKVQVCKTQLPPPTWHHEDTSKSWWSQQGICLSVEVKTEKMERELP